MSVRRFAAYFLVLTIGSTITFTFGLAGRAAPPQDPVEAAFSQPIRLPAPQRLAGHLHPGSAAGLLRARRVD